MRLRVPAAALALLAGVGAFLLGTAQSADACSCALYVRVAPVAEVTTEELDAAIRVTHLGSSVELIQWPPLPPGAVIFEGVVRDTRQLPTSGPPSSVVYAFEVERVVQGVMRDPPEVSTAASSAACGTRFALGTRYRITAHWTAEADSRLTTGSCAYNQPLLTPSLGAP
jgi:hypothetical protein